MNNYEILEDLDKIVKFMVNPLFLIIVALIVWFVGRVFFKIKYAECFEIFARHLDSIRKKNGKLSKRAFLFYYIVPIFFAISITGIRKLDDDVLNILTVIISILTSLFFTLLTLILETKAKNSEDKSYSSGDAKLLQNILKETYYSIMFEILVSVVLLIFCFLELFAGEYSWASSCLIYYMTFIILINMFIILKKIFKAIEKQIK